MATSEISNYRTSVMGRTASRTDLTKQEMDKLVVEARRCLGYEGVYTWNADINGVIIQLVTNSFHLADFWMENWYPSFINGIQPHGIIYAATCIPEREPFAYYCSESKTAVFFNTDYYGQCKSWALGIAADMMEMQQDVHSIHGAVVDIAGSGIAIIAPTGTGKSTQCYGIVLSVPNARVHSDDWCYVQYVGGEKHGRAVANISERKFYLRTDIAGNYPRLGQLFQKCKLENVGETWGEVPNSRVVLDPMWLNGPDSFVHVTRLRSVILLRRDKTSPPEKKLDLEEALQVLKKGEYTVQPGAGSKEDWGKTKQEPFYNPYLLVRNEQRTEIQLSFFRRLFQITDCYILNTGVETVEQTHQRILRIARESTRRAVE